MLEMEQFEKNQTIKQEEEIKQQVNISKEIERYCIEDLRKIVNLKFSNHTEFAKAMDWDRSTACRLLTGDWIPQQEKVILKLADVLNLNAVKLTRLFDNSYNKMNLRDEVKNEN